MSARPAYVWWPSYHPRAVDIGDAKSAPRHVLSVVVLTTILCFPPVTRATGIRAAGVVFVIGAHLVWSLFGTFVLLPNRSLARKARQKIVVAGNLLVNVGVVTALPILTRDPRTPLWMFPVLYACINGTGQENEPSVAFLLAHALSPLIALVPVVVTGVYTGWAVAAPLLCGAICAASYHHLASVSAHWRRLRREREDARAKLRAEVATRDRARLMRELNESIGATLGVVGMYGDMIERHLNRPEELRLLAAQVRDAARAGLGDLRGVIGAMAPLAADVDGLAGTLRQSADRSVEGTKAEVVVRVVRGGEVSIDGPVRLALVRVFQDAVHDALGRGEAQRIEARLASDGEAVSLEVADDGTGDRSDTARIDRMGLRARELGGTLSMEGAVIRMSLPRTRT